MGRKNISREKIIQAFVSSSFEKSAGATSLSDVSDILGIKKASLYNHFESREEMYNESIIFCKKEIGSINFLQDKTFETIRSNKILPTTLFKKLISRYFNLFEQEPLFQMYIFVYTEQYYNDNALEIIQLERDKLEEAITKILITIKETKNINRPEKDIKDCAASISSIIHNRLETYLAERKSVVRKNPESGNGTLFALPTDDMALNKTVKIVEFLVKELFDL